MTIQNSTHQNNVSNQVQSDPHDYWRENYLNRPYYQEAQLDTPDLDYDRDFSKAYEIGHRARADYDQDTDFNHVEGNLKESWENVKAESRLKWEQAKQAMKDAWDRL